MAANAATQARCREVHPAYSVIAFTTLSGAGLGLLVWFALLALLGAVPSDPVVGFFGLGIALAMTAGGLLSSTLHLGRPERAWRAFSQWRTSWLSREGVCAVATFVPALLLALGWVIFGTYRGPFAIAAFLTIPLAAATVACTGMIYQSLPTIRAWHQPVVTPIYCLLALATGGVLAVFLLRSFRIDCPAETLAVVALLAITAVAKRAYWLALDAKPPRYSAGEATGLGRFGTVRPLDPPHTEPNFVMREMGYAIGRKHAHALRRIALLAGFVVPALLLLLSLAVAPLSALLLASLAVGACAAGIFVERWLFFAEAQHVVTLFYGAQTA